MVQESLSIATSSMCSSVLTNGEERDRILIASSSMLSQLRNTNFFTPWHKSGEDRKDSHCVHVPKSVVYQYAAQFGLIYSYMKVLFVLVHKGIALLLCIPT